MGERKKPRQKLRPIWGASWFHRAQIERSELCGCFSCERTFPPAAISGWTDARGSDGSGQTALCPFCGVDAVIGSGADITITAELLAKLRKSYFGEENL